jgi:hypothetical protein
LTDALWLARPGVRPAGLGPVLAVGLWRNLLDSGEQTELPPLYYSPLK